LEWNNGLLITSERLLVADGGRKAPAAGSQLRIDLRHVTGDMRSGLCLFTNSSDAPYLLPTEIKCSNSILLSGNSGALIEQAGIDSVAEFRKQLHWDSERNFYDGIRVFWKIRGRNLLDQPEEASFTNWQAFWRGSERSWGRVGWKKLPEAGRAVASCTPADYALDRTLTNNPAIRGAADGRDAGCDPAKLPELPATADDGARQRF